LHASDLHPELHPELNLTLQRNVVTVPSHCHRAHGFCPDHFCQPPAMVLWYSLTFTTIDAFSGIGVWNSCWKGLSLRATCIIVYYSTVHSLRAAPISAEASVSRALSLFRRLSCLLQCLEDCCLLLEATCLLDGRWGG
jgi:hypothetical protein